MPSRNEQYEGLFQPWEVAVAVNVVAEYRRKWTCLEKEAFEDLVQECLSRWQNAKPKFNPAVGAPPHAFMAKVVRNHMGKTVRALCRDKRRVLAEADSLDMPVTETATLQDKWELSHYDEATPREIELRLDMAAVLALLSPRQRELCRLLRQEGLNIKEASAAMKMPRATLYGDIERIRAIFAEAKLDEYLHRKNPADTFQKHGVSMSGGDHE
ncbi:MAG: sigma-70 family RNA polymerase sigma factor [Elusimicrobiales bacterium]|nr:sigma-70 family RNA polymerase sigma factor [Elusimicrobiales bacterium]